LLTWAKNRICVGEISHGSRRQKGSAIEMASLLAKRVAVSVHRVLKSTTLLRPVFGYHKISPFTSHTDSDNNSLHIDLSNEESKRTLFNRLVPFLDLFIFIFMMINKLTSFVLLLLIGYCIEASNEGFSNSIWFLENGYRTIFTPSMKIIFDLSFISSTWYFFLSFPPFFLFFIITCESMIMMNPNANHLWVLICGLCKYYKLFL